MTAQEALKTYFGYDSFRPGQDTVVSALLSGRDALAIMPTGAGKSLCYQIPALLLPGITLVVSPLISLMQDQVKALNDVGVHAAFINSALTEGQIRKALSLAAQGVYKIIYVAPERLESWEFLDFATHTEISMETEGFQAFAREADISLVAVDEAHCISQWGQDFRPSYVKIVDFIRKLGRRPVVSAFTATATENVRDDILRTLQLANPNVVVTGFDRENLYYSVEHIRKKDDFILDYIEKHPSDSGIIYCATRKNVDKLYEELFKRGVAVTRYHAGLGGAERKKNQEDFIYDRAPVVVATNAFGMGIDKSNVRFVIHYNMPQSMENYYQEAGRAGRDGEPAQCILLFSPQDMMINRFLLEQKDFSELTGEEARLIRQRDTRRLQTMEQYCRGTGCLRNYILQYFGEETEDPCENCGNCHREYTEIDLTEEARQVVKCVTETRGRYGIQIVIGTLLGANRVRLRELGMMNYESYGSLKEKKEADLRALISQMVSEGYLRQTEEQYSVLKLGDTAPLMKEDARVMLRTWKAKEPEKKKKTAKVKSTDGLTSAGSELFEVLRKLRMEIARENGVPPYIVFNDKTLIDMCVKLPATEEEFLEVSGVGENKRKKYGRQFLDAIAEFQQEKEEKAEA